MDYDDNDLEPLFFETRTEVDSVLEHLSGRITSQGRATVSDLLQFIGLKASPVHEDYGWTSISKFDAIMDKNGLYELNVPNFRHLYPSTLEGMV